MELDVNQCWWMELMTMVIHNAAMAQFRSTEDVELKCGQSELGVGTKCQVKSLNLPTTTFAHGRAIGTINLAQLVNSKANNFAGNVGYKFWHRSCVIWYFDYCEL